MSEKIDLENIPRYKNTVSQNLDFNKQIQKKIDAAFSKASNEKFIKLEKELQEKNTYFAKSKIPEVNDNDIKTQTMKSSSAIRNPLNEVNDYCQKCPSLKNHCPHKNPKHQIKDKYSYPILTSSVYGWMPPVDKFQENHNIRSATKDFNDHSHL
jgi:hypothetical protein